MPNIDSQGIVVTDGGGEVNVLRGDDMGDSDHAEHCANVKLHDDVCIGGLGGVFLIFLV